MNKLRIALALAVVAIPLGSLGFASRSSAVESDAPEHASPPGMPRVDPPDGNFAGEIRERVGAGSYTYLLVSTADGGREWVVTLGGGVPVGSRVDVINMGVRHDFRSRRLARTFDRLVFAIVRERG